MLGNLAPRLYQPEPGLARELASQRALLTSLSKQLRAAAPAVNAAPTTVVAAACDTTVVQANLETSVRQALAQDRKDAEEEAKDRGISPDNAQIYAKADQWLDAKIRAKHWSSADSVELLRASVGLSQEQRTALRLRVIRALNAGEITDTRFE